MGQTGIWMLGIIGFGCVFFVAARYFQQMGRVRFRDWLEDDL